MRYISLTEELKQKALLDFQNRLNEARFSDTKINFTLDLNNSEALEDKVIINILPEAWLKMWSLVSTTSGEIGWHGIVERVNTKIFIIKDILVYPQEVTSATVQTDDVEYGNWLHHELTDEQINNLRFHGHSHVNMSTSPSGVDTTWYNEILQGLMNNDFYIFAILNKREEYFIELYDLATNTIYEKKDIIINVMMSDGNYLQNWVEQNKEKYLKSRNPIGFQSTTSYYHDTKTEKETEVESLEDIILDLIVDDLQDEELSKYIMEMINKEAMWCGYFNVGYMAWNNMTKEERFKTAQKYYTNRPKKKGRPKKNKLGKRVYDYGWEDEWK